MDKNVIYHLSLTYRKIFQFQTPGWQAGLYLLFQGAVPHRPGNDRAVSVLLKCLQCLAESSMLNSPYNQNLQFQAA